MEAMDKAISGTVFERLKLRVRVLTIFSTCTSKISYVYQQKQVNPDNEDITLTFKHL